MAAGLSLAAGSTLIPTGSTSARRRSRLTSEREPKKPRAPPQPEGCRDHLRRRRQCQQRMCSPEPLTPCDPDDALSPLSSGKPTTHLATPPAAASTTQALREKVLAERGGLSARWAEAESQVSRMTEALEARILLQQEKNQRPSAPPERKPRAPRHASRGDATDWLGVRSQFEEILHTAAWHRVAFLHALGYPQFAGDEGERILFPEQRHGGGTHAGDEAGAVLALSHSPAGAPPETLRISAEVIRSGAPKVRQPYPPGLPCVERQLIEACSLSQGVSRSSEQLTERNSRAQKTLRCGRPEEATSLGSISQSTGLRFLSGLGRRCASPGPPRATPLSVADFPSQTFLSLSSGIADGRFTLWSSLDVPTGRVLGFTHDAEPSGGATAGASPGPPFASWERSVASGVGRGGEVSKSPFPPHALAVCTPEGPRRICIADSGTTSASGVEVVDVARESCPLGHGVGLAVSQITYTGTLGMGVLTRDSEPAAAAPPFPPSPSPPGETTPPCLHPPAEEPAEAPKQPAPAGGAPKTPCDVRWGRPGVAEPPPAPQLRATESRLVVFDTQRCSGEDAESTTPQPCTMVLPASTSGGVWGCAGGAPLPPQVGSPSMSFNGDLALWLTWDASEEAQQSGSRLHCARVRRSGTPPASAGGGSPEGRITLSPAEVRGCAPSGCSTVVDGSERSLVLSPEFLQDNSMVYLCDQTCETFRLYLCEYDNELESHKPPASVLHVGKARGCTEAGNPLIAVMRGGSGRVVVVVSNFGETDALTYFNLDSKEASVYPQTAAAGLTRLWGIQCIDDTRVACFASGPSIAQNIIVFDACYRSVRSIASCDAACSIPAPPVVTTACEIGERTYLYPPAPGSIPHVPEHSGEAVVEGRVPLIIIPHCGFLDAWCHNVYDGETQFWCSQGYGVVHCVISDPIEFARSVRKSGLRGYIASAAGRVMEALRRVELFVEVDYYHITLKGRGVAGLLALYCSQLAGSLARAVLLGGAVLPPALEGHPVLHLPPDTLPMSVLRAPIHFSHSRDEKSAPYDGVVRYHRELLQCFTYHGRCELLTTASPAAHSDSWILSAEAERRFLLSAVWEAD